MNCFRRPLDAIVTSAEDIAKEEMNAAREGIVNFIRSQNGWQDFADDGSKTTAFFIGENRKRYKVQHKADAHQLFQKLGEGGNGSLFATDVVPVDAGGNGAKRKDQGKNPQGIGSPGFH